MTRADDAWLAGPVLDVAPRLLGARLSTHLPDGVVTVRLTEVEAYDGADDPASHAYRGRTERNAAMFGPPGHLYVYRHLGLHVCMNVVTGAAGRASAVLFRAGEVIEGVEVARSRRLRRGALRSDVDLARGPARLATSLGIDLTVYVDLDGTDLLDVGIVRLEPPGQAGDGVVTGPRVGVSGVGGDAGRHPWRFWLPGEPTVSAYRAASARNRRRPQT